MSADSDAEGPEGTIVVSLQVVDHSALVAQEVDSWIGSRMGARQKRMRASLTTEETNQAK